MRQNIEMFDCIPTEFLPDIGIACVGSLIQSLKEHWLGWKNLVVSLTTAIFGALIFGVLLKDLGFSEAEIFFVAALIGYSGGELVDIVLRDVKDKIDHDNSNHPL